MAITKQLTYHGRNKAARGDLLGPDGRGRVWVVLEQIYDEDKDLTFVTVELPQVPQPEDAAAAGNPAPTNA